MKKYLISIFLVLSILLLCSCETLNNNESKESNSDIADTNKTIDSNELNDESQNTEGNINNKDNSNETTQNTEINSAENSSSAVENYSIKICGYSDSVSGISHELEYKDWSQDAFVDSAAEKRVSFAIENLAIIGNYVETEKRFSEFYNTHTYKDENNRYFSLTEDGKLCTYFFGNDSSNSENKKVYTEAECVKVASKFVSNFVDVSEYTISTVFNENRKMYTVSFEKYIDGFKCSDRADIMIEETGYMYSFSSTMLGRISSTATTKFNSKTVQEQIVSRLDNEYSKVNQNYDKIEYKNFDYELTIDGNGEYALICSVKVACIKSYGEYETIDSELIQLLIQ